MKAVRAVAVALALLIVGAACNVPAPVQPPPPTSAPPAAGGPLRPDALPSAAVIRGRVYGLEVVRAGEPGYYKGLGERDALPQDRGMLFLESQDVATTFWMKGMRFPLDIVWIDWAGRIVHLERNVPHQPGAPDNQLVIYRPASPARAVLELNAGQADTYGFQVGDQALFIYD